MAVVEFLRARAQDDFHEAQQARDVFYDDGPDDTGWEWRRSTAQEYLARFSPDRVLAEAEAKLRIISEHIDGEAWCDHCSGGEHMGDPDHCVTLRLLALPYADHPDYNEEWKP